VGRWIAAAIVLFVAVVLIHSVATNPRFGWGTVGHYLFDPAVLRGARTTVVLTVVSIDRKSVV